jgi:hypothetical protein
MPQSKAIAVIKPSEFAVLQSDMSRVEEVIKSNIGTDLSIFDLDRVKVPSAGGLAWEINTLEGIDAVKELTGIIVFFRDVRAFWENPLDEGGGGSPPDCHSNDMFRGVGDPGGECGTCPMAQFDSALKGEGQACKAIRRIFMVTQDTLLPTLISVPPTSLQPAKSYMVRLASHQTSYFEVVTKLTLEKTKSAGGVEYSKIRFSSAGALSEKEITAIKRYREVITPGLGNITAADASEAKQGGVE